ncbi:Reverse transcriptase domain, partial [Cinara cedri]
EIDELKLSDLDYEEYEDCEQILVCNNKNNRIDLLLDVLRVDHLNAEEKESIYEICFKYADCPGYKNKKIEKQIKELEDSKTIVKSSSTWNAPLFVVPKKDDASGIKKYRVCVDFRKLNEVTVGNVFPLPQITEILDELGKCKYFTTIDLASGYHQIELDEKDTEKTGFSTGVNHYKFLRLPFGLKGGPSTFQRLMNNVLTRLQGVDGFVYLDDIIVFAPDLKVYNERLEKVMCRLREHNLRVQPAKCEFLKKEVTYLGHIITENGVRPDERKIESVVNFPLPKIQREIKGFLGLTGFYRKFIQNYSQISDTIITMKDRTKLEDLKLGNFSQN